MDAQRFDALTRSVAERMTRRRLLRGVGGGLAAALLGRPVAGAPRCKQIDQSCRTTADCCPNENGTYCAGTKKTTCQPCAGTICKGGCTICSPTEIVDPTLNCACVCRPGLTRCNGVCLDLQSDAANCGGCGQSCDDGNVCTTDACLAGQCSNTIIPSCCESDPECEDGDLCTTNSCVGNQCQIAPVVCPGEDLCTGVGCAPPTGCFTFSRCDDGNDCTEDSCDQGTGACQNIPLTGTACVLPGSGNTGVCANGTCVPPQICEGQDFCERVRCDNVPECTCATAFRSGEPFCAGPIDTCRPCLEDEICRSFLGDGARCVSTSGCCPGGATCVLPCGT